MRDVKMEDSRNGSVRCRGVLYERCQNLGVVGCLLLQRNGDAGGRLASPVEGSTVEGGQFLCKSLDPKTLSDASAIRLHNPHAAPGDSETTDDVFESARIYIADTYRFVRKQYVRVSLGKAPNKTSHTIVPISLII